jgi:uncharacterized protein YhaN
MKITELQVERFGVWSDLTLPLTPGSTSVFYGPNEAGKSTLMRFIRAMLFGFRPQDERTAGPNPTPIRCDGALRIEKGGREHLVRRISSPGTRGRLLIDGVEDPIKTESLMKNLLGGITEPIYENIFAIGLNELQELATLDGEEVARHIYGISLGIDGERILKAYTGSESEGKLLLDESGRDGKLLGLVRDLDAVDRELVALGDPSRKYEELVSKRDQLDSDISGCKQRQVQLQREIRGRAFMERVYVPWNKERQLRREMDGLPQLVDFPSDGLQRIDGWDTELENIDGRRRQALVEVERLEAEVARNTLDPRLEEQATAIRQMLGEQESVRFIERRLVDRRARQDITKRQLDAALAGLKGRWATDRLEETEFSPAALYQLSQAARQLQAAGTGRARIIRRYKQYAAIANRKLASTEEQVRHLGGLTFPQAREHAQRRLDELEQLIALRARESTLTELLSGLDVQVNLINRPKDLPDYFYATLWFFGIAGMLLLVAGLLSLLELGPITQTASWFFRNAPWLVGATYLSVATLCGGVVWVMKEHFEPSRYGLDTLQRRRRDVEHELSEIRHEIVRITQLDVARGPMPTLADTMADEPDQLTEESVARAIRRRIAEFDALERQSQRVVAIRNRMSRLRQALKNRQRDIVSSRRYWCEQLRRLGMPETLKVKEAFELLQLVADAKRLWIEWRDDNRELEIDDRRVQDFRSRVEGMARRNGSREAKLDWYQLLSHWEIQLRQIEDSRALVTRLVQELDDKRKRLNQIAESMSPIRAQRSAMLTKAGATDRADLVAKLKAFQRYNELVKLHAAAKDELALAARQEPDLAVVEDDLLRFVPEKNEEETIHLRVELVQIDEQLQKLFEKLGRIKQEILDLENDRRASSLKFERAQLADELNQSVQRWLALKASGQTVEKMRSRVERTCQPEILKHASEYLERLTLGKYHNIWTPLGQRHLVVDDEKSESLKVEHLSKGTREQVFLSIRLAVMKDFADRGVELPMVLDDIMVNFDQLRTEAAVRTLLEFAEQGQQILMFSCHLHLAHLFENQGIEPIWLPARAGTREGQRA